MKHAQKYMHQRITAMLYCETFGSVKDITDPKNKALIKGCAVVAGEIINAVEAHYDDPQDPDNEPDEEFSGDDLPLLWKKSTRIR